MENNSTVLALVGERAAELALAQAEPGTELCRETGVPYFPKLGARQNAVNLRMVMKPEQAELFWELLKVGGVRKAGWNLPFRQDQPGILRLYGLVLALSFRDRPVLAIEPMAGMTPEDREGFSGLLLYCLEHGLKLTYTADRLKDVMELNVPQPLRLATPEGWRDTDTAEMERERAAIGEKAGWDLLQLEWEGEGNE